MDKFTYLKSSVSLTETDINTRQAKAWTAIDNLSIIWKSDLTDKVKRSFFPSSGRINTAVWMHYMDPNYTYGEKAWRQSHKNAVSNIKQVPEAAPHKQQLYGHLPSITKTIKVRRTRHAGHCWKSRDELIIDLLLWTTSYGRAKSGRPARTCIQRLYADTACDLEGLLEAMDQRKGRRERGRDISVLMVRHDNDDIYIYEGHGKFWEVLVSNVWDGNILVDDWRLPLLCYVQLQTSTLAKGMNPAYYPQLGFNSTFY